MRITFIGGGNMAGAMIGGLLGRGFQASDIVGVDPSADARARLRDRHGVRTAEVPDASVLACDVLVLAVKPQQVRAVAESLAGRLVQQLVVTIAAGIRIPDLMRWLGGYTRVVRAMPNTPALVGAGIAGVFAPATVDEEGRAVAGEVLGAVGRVVWVNVEAMLDAVTAVSGSGPAYVFYFLEALARAARELGFDAATARTLAYATFDGAVKLALASPESADVLRERVTSKGGTTERAIGILSERSVDDAIVEAAKAAAARAGELGDVLGEVAEGAAG